MIIISTEVDEYFRAVQARLDDLSPEVIEELTGGLAADLSDVAAESEQSLPSRLGPPAAYADELRAAAGLSPRVSAVAEASWRSSWNSVKQSITSHPRYPALRALAIDLRPLWWVLRAGALGLLSYTVVGFYSVMSASSLLYLLLLVGLSIALGRREGSFSGTKRLGMRVINGGAAVLCLWAVLVALTSPWFVPEALSSPAYSGEIAGQASPGDGLWGYGGQVFNLYAYDAQGNLIEQVQLFDQEGRPINYREPRDEPDVFGDQPQWETLTDAYGKKLTNIYPQNFQSPLTNPMSGELIPMKPPFRIVPPLAKATPAADPSPSPDSTKSPTAKPDRTESP